MKYISSFELFEGYNKPRAGGKRRWSVKYKKKIDCSNPKGFSQKQYCKRKRRGGHYKTESLEYNHVQEILNNLKDMSLELWDENFNVQISEYVISPDAKYIIINLYKKSTGRRELYVSGSSFNWIEIKDTLLQMCDYLHSEGLVFSSMDAFISVKSRDYRCEVGFKGEDLCFLKNTLFGAKMGDVVDMPIGQLIVKYKQ